MQGGYWWQEESREKRAFRLLVDLAVDLGRLPTIREAKEYDESLPSDAAIYYGSYDNLCQRVAGHLYGHTARTYPADIVEFMNRWMKTSTPEELQASYVARLEQLGLKPENPERLTKPAPLPEPLAEVTPRKYTPNSLQNDLLTTTTGKVINRRTGREVGYATKTARSKQRSSEVVNSHEESQSLNSADVMPKTEGPAEELDAMMAELQTIIQGVASQVVIPAVEAVVRAEETKILKKEVETMAGKRKISREDCVLAVRQAYAAIGDKAFKQVSYNQYAKEHGLPTRQTMEKNLGKQREWRKFLEDAPKVTQQEKTAALGLENGIDGAVETNVGGAEPLGAAVSGADEVKNTAEQQPGEAALTEPVRREPEAEDADLAAALDLAQKRSGHYYHDFWNDDDPDTMHELSEATRSMEGSREGKESEPESALMVKSEEEGSGPEVAGMNERAGVIEGGSTEDSDTEFPVPVTEIKKDAIKVMMSGGIEVRMQVQVTLRWASDDEESENIGEC